MTVAAARMRAERCFAVARSTSFDGERAAAVLLGTRIAHEAGLPLDQFDIPGRVRATQEPLPRWMPRPQTIVETVEDLEMAAREAAERVGARPGETAYDAAYRNFLDEASAAKKRDAARALRLEIDQAVSVLWNAGLRCHPETADRETWLIELDGRLGQVHAQTLLDLAFVVTDLGDSGILGVFPDAMRHASAAA